MLTGDFGRFRPDVTDQHGGLHQGMPGQQGQYQMQGANGPPLQNQEHPAYK